MRPPQRAGTPLLPTHGHALQKHRTKQRRGALVSRLIVITVVTATVAYGGFAWLYLGKSHHSADGAATDAAASGHAHAARSLKEKAQHRHQQQQQHQRQAGHAAHQRHRHEVQPPRGGAARLHQQQQRGHKRAPALHEATDDLHRVVWHGAGAKAEDATVQQKAADLLHQADIKQQEELHKAETAKAPETDSTTTTSTGGGGGGLHLDTEHVAQHPGHEADAHAPSVEAAHGREAREGGGADEAEQVHHGGHAQQHAQAEGGGEHHQVSDQQAPHHEHQHHHQQHQQQHQRNEEQLAAAGGGEPEQDDGGGDEYGDEEYLSKQPQRGAAHGGDSDGQQEQDEEQQQDDDGGVAAPRHTPTVHSQSTSSSHGGGGGGGGGSRAAGDVPAGETEQVHHEPTSLFQLSAKDIDGEERALSVYRGNVTLVVNVASACGYTDDNYKGLQKLYEKYHSHGLEILGFPCNQFGSQEPKPEPEIKHFCSTRYHVTFPLFSKVHVNGPLTHPVYKFLKSHTPADQGGGGGKGPGEDIGWNFFKFLVDHKGRPVKRFNQAWNQVEVEQAVYHELMARHGADSGTAQASR